MKRDAGRYFDLVFSIIFFDQLTKLFALSYWQDEYVLTQFLSFKVIFNRGISWGLLSLAQTNSLLFIAISGIIFLVTLGLAIYSFSRYNNGYSVYGELLVIAGSCSNLIDRCFQKGVIDFIVVHWNDYVWPVFNVADAAIVCGVGIMLVQHLTQGE
jgi:signal peptidase II